MMQHGRGARERRSSCRLCYLKCACALCGTLPLVLVETLGMAAVPVMAVLCWCVFGIEEIGHLIEQPFYGRVCALASNCKPVRAEVVLVRC